MSQSKSVLLQLAEATGRVFGVDPERFEPAFVEEQIPWFGRLFGPGRYFDTVVHGFEHVPTVPSLVVSNHSGGSTVIDGFGFVTQWYLHFGSRRPIHGLLHELPFASRRVGRYLERCGMLRASPEAAGIVLGALHRDLMVMPGGDQDVWRPASARYEVRWGGRVGYARTAVEHQVPIVPVAHVGAHHTLHVLTDGHELARRLKFVRALTRAEVLPVYLSLPWGISFLPLPHLPPPTLLEYRIAEPIEPPVSHSDAAVHALDVEVRRRIQAELDVMREADVEQRRLELRRAVRRLREGAESVRDLVDGLLARAEADHVLRPRGQAAK